MNKLNGYLGEPRTPASNGKVIPVTSPSVYQTTMEVPTDRTRDVDEATIASYWRILVRRKRTLLMGAVSGFILALGVSLLQTPLYRVRTSVEVQDVNENFLYSKQLDPNAGIGTYSAESNLPTQVRLLKSDRLVQRTIEKLHLYDRPEMKKKSIFSKASERLSQFLPFLQTTLAQKQDGARQRTYALVTKRLNVQIATQLAAQTRLLEVIFDWPNPDTAVEFANALTREYIADTVEAKWQTAQNTGDWLNRQLQELKGKLEQSEAELQTYTRASGFLFTGEQKRENIADEKLRQLQTDLSVASSDRILKQSKNELARKFPTEALPEVLDNPGMRESQSRLTDLRRQLADLSTTLTPAHYRVQKIQAQIEALEADIAKQRQDVLARLNNEYDAAQRRENLLTSAFQSQSQVVTTQAAKMIHYDLLRREVDANRQLYEGLLQRVRESSISAALRASNLRVVDVAQKPWGTYSPNLPLNAVIGLLVGTFGGIMLVFLRENLGSQIHEPGTVSKYLNVPELGTIPIASAEGNRRNGRRNLLDLRGSKQGELITDISNFEGGERSLLAECFRGTLTSLFLSATGKSPQVIVITSTAPQEGKTTVASNLAISAAQVGHRVLLIDGDLRRARLDSVFNIGNTPGLAELLEATDPIDNINLKPFTREANTRGLSILPSGAMRANPDNLLYGTRFRQLISRVRRDFDYIFIDTPPVLHIPDARIIAAASDGAAIVIRANRTNREAVLAIRSRFAEDGIPVLGTILNHWDPKQAADRSYYAAYEAYASGSTQADA